MAQLKSKVKAVSKSKRSTNGTSKTILPEYVKARTVSKDDLEFERVLSDLERNKTSLKTKIDNNREAIINLKDQNKDILREKNVDVVRFISNEKEIEDLENGILKLEDFGKRFYGL